MNTAQIQKGKVTAKFGDTIINHWASENNPHRKGICVRMISRGIQVTDGNGEFWELVNDAESKTEVIPAALPYSPGEQAVDQKEEKKPLRLEDFPHLLELEKRVKAIRFGTAEYWKERCIYREKMDDPTYTDFERSNCDHFHRILVNKNI